MSDTAAIEPLRLTLEHEAKYVAGFPQWVFVELENPDPHLSLTHVEPIVPGYRCSDLHLIVRTGERAVAELHPKHAEDLHGQAIGERFGPGQRRASLFDLDAMLALEPGVYELQVEYPATSPARASSTTTLQILEPTSAERDAARRRSDEGWMLTIVREAAPLAIGPDAASERTHEQLRVHARLHMATWRRGWSSFEIAELFAALPRRFDPFAAVASYELGLLEGQAASASVRASIVARWPAWSWWVEAADAGRGLLASLRGRRATLGHSDQSETV